MATRRYKRKSLRRKGKRSRVTRRSIRGGKWNPEYYKLGANNDYNYAPCSLTYSSIRAAANMPNHGYKIKNY